MSSGDLRTIDVADLLERPGRRRQIEGDHEFHGPTTVAATPTGVTYDLVLESRGGRLVVEGRAVGRWRGECRRCLAPVPGESTIEVQEIFEARPTEGETYPIEDGRIDLAAMLEEAVVLALPLAPLCDSSCAGPAPDLFPTGSEEEEPADGPDRDPRWAALDELTFE